MAPIFGLADGTYTIVNAQFTGEIFDVNGGDGRTVIGYPPNDGANQRWTVKNFGLFYTIQVVSSGLYLGIDGDAPAEGKQLIVDTKQSKWSIQEDFAKRGTYRITPAFAFGLAATLVASRNNVTLQCPNGGLNSNWTFKTA